MKIPSIIQNNPVLVGGVLIVGVGLAWLAIRGAGGMGKDLGKGAVDFVAGAVGGAGNAVVDNALYPEVNPFYDVGTSLGGWIFDITHPVGK